MSYCTYLAANGSTSSCSEGYAWSFALYVIALMCLMAMTIGMMTANFISAGRAPKTKPRNAHPEPHAPFRPSSHAVTPRSGVTPREQHHEPHGQNAAYADADAAADDDEWVLDEETGYQWSDKQQLYFDTDSGHYYDPNSEQWYDPENDQWYEG